MDSTLNLAETLNEALWLLKRAYYEGDQEDWSERVEKLMRKVEDDL